MSKASGVKEASPFLRDVKNDIKAGDWKAAHQKATSKIETDPNHAAAHHVVACARVSFHSFASALDSAEQAHALAPKIREYAQLIADIFIHAGDLTNSLHYAKLATALPSDPHLADIRPANLRPYNEALADVKETPLLENATEAAQQGDPMGAEHWFRQHLSFFPDAKEAYQGLVTILAAQGRYQEAAQIMRGACHALPGDPQITSDLAGLIAATGDFPLARALHQWSKDLAPDDLIVHAAAIRDMLSDPLTDHDAVTQAMETWSRKFGLTLKTKSAAPKASKKQSLNVGFLVGKASRHVVASALAQIIANIDRKSFKTIGFGFGALGDPANGPFQPAFDRWLDVTDVDPVTFAAMVAGEEVDLMIDLSGLKTPGLLSAFNAPMAPVQAGWTYNHPPSGLAAMSGALSDAYLDPKPARQSKKAETILRLEHGVTPLSLPETTEQAPAPVTSENGVIFGVDACLKEINAQSIAAWATALRAVPDSKLVLRDVGFSGEDADRLIGLFGAFGVAHRIETEAAASSLELFEQVHLALIAPNCERPDLVMDALWQGRPVIVLDGEDRHRRIPGSLLHHLGFADDMVAGSLVEYGRLAKEWARDPDKLRKFSNDARDLMRASKSTDVAAQAKDLEKAFLALWETALKRKQA